jgi:RNA polymerase sigma factor (sigma-70 family)
VVNLAARQWRRLAIGRRRDRAALQWLTVAQDAPDVVAERDRTLRAVMALPVRRRAIVVLRFYEDLSLRQIATVLDVSEGTVKSQLSRALEQLRAQLEDQERT